MVKEADEFSSKDKMVKEQIDYHNGLESLAKFSIVNIKYVWTPSKLKYRIIEKKIKIDKLNDMFLIELGDTMKIEEIKLDTVESAIKVEFKICKKHIRSYMERNLW